MATKPAVPTSSPSRTVIAPVPCLSRQGMANQASSSIDKVAHGSYILEDCDGTPELILIGTGTELDLCVQAAKQLGAEGKKVRVVSMPCVELFDEQSDAYKEQVLPTAVRKRIVVEQPSWLAPFHRPRWRHCHDESLWRLRSWRHLHGEVRLHG